MVETMNFKIGETLVRLKFATTNLNVRGILMSHCRQHKNTRHIPLNWLIRTVIRMQSSLLRIRVHFSEGREGEGLHHCIKTSCSSPTFFYTVATRWSIPTGKSNVAWQSSPEDYKIFEQFQHKNAKVCTGLQCPFINILLMLQYIYQEGF
jgi:hypothetical protein